jgi:3-deoxy-D-manno-octulosonate 8-phosphate phosphatase (KDO 8-P phosphatase)
MAYLHRDAKDKIKILEEILAEAGVGAEECGFIGDDLVDNPPMRRVGLAIAVADAAEDKKQTAHYVTSLKGGYGAVREVCDLF